jgi:macrolide-specific efflux system membrane fusion protein
MASMTRKEFVTLTLTLVGGGALAAGCGSSGTSGTGGAGGSSSGGATGHGGSGAGGSVDAGPSCMDPLPEMQLADSTAHVHTFVVTAALLTSTSAIDLQTGPFPVGSGGHLHTVTLSAANLATLRGGGSVTVMSTMAGTPAHSHMYMLSCKAD